MYKRLDIYQEHIDRFKLEIFNKIKKSDKMCNIYNNRSTSSDDSNMNYQRKNKLENSVHNNNILTNTNIYNNGRLMSYSPNKSKNLQNSKILIKISKKLKNTKFPKKSKNSQTQPNTNNNLNTNTSQSPNKYTRSDTSDTSDSPLPIQSPDDIILNNIILHKYFSYSTLETVANYFRVKSSFNSSSKIYTLIKSANLDFEIETDMCKPLIGTNEIQIYDRRKRMLIKKKINLDKMIHGYSVFQDGMRHLLINDKLFITGGRDEKTEFSTTLMYDMRGDLLKRLPDMKYARSYHSMEYCDSHGLIFSIGGQNNKTCEAFDLNSKNWILLPELNIARANISLHFDNYEKRIFAFFGVKGEITTAWLYSDVVEVLDLKEIQGTQREDSNDNRYNNSNGKSNGKSNGSDNNDNSYKDRIEGNNFRVGVNRNDNVDNNTNRIFDKSWVKLDYSNKSELDFKKNYCGLYPLTKQLILLYGVNGPRHPLKSFAVFDVNKNVISKVDKKMLEDIRVYARKNIKLSKIISSLSQ